jgi:peroxiredoxin Q/BCP
MLGADRLMDATVSVFHRVPPSVRQAIKARVYPPTLREGEAAPELHLLGHDGDYHLLGDDWALLVFYPGDETPGCTRQLRRLEELRGDFTDLGCRVFGVNPASRESHARFAEKEGLGFPLLVDREARAALQYRAVLPVGFGSPRVLRTVYLINPQRKIRLANRGAPSLEAILRSIQALKYASRTGM